MLTPGQRRARSILAAEALHMQDPDVAHRAGRSTADGYAGGSSSWGRMMALRRWHRTPFRYRRSMEAEPDESEGFHDPGS
jgi:hypothetical protein